MEGLRVLAELAQPLLMVPQVCGVGLLFVLLDHELRLELRQRKFAILVLVEGLQLVGRLQGPHRGFDWFDVPLDHLKAIRRASECSITDVVLTTVTGAVREYLLHRGVDPQRLDFRVSAPVSVRREEERGKLGNRVSSWIVPLPLGEAFHSRRLTLVSSQVGRIPADRAPRWDHARRLGVALDLLADERLDSLISGESDFETLPEVMGRLVEDGRGILCHRIRYAQP